MCIRDRLHHIADDILDHVLGGIHITVQIGEVHLRLHHPELGGVTLSVGILRTEGRTKGIDIAEGHGEVLGVQLTGHRQAGLLAEEVLTVIQMCIRDSSTTMEELKRRKAAILGIRQEQEQISRRIHCLLYTSVNEKSFP